MGNGWVTTPLTHPTHRHVQRAAKMAPPFVGEVAMPCLSVDARGHYELLGRRMDGNRWNGSMDFVGSVFSPVEPLLTGEKDMFISSSNAIIIILYIICILTQI